MFRDNSIILYPYYYFTLYSASIFHSQTPNSLFKIHSGIDPGSVIVARNKKGIWGIPFFSKAKKVQTSFSQRSQP